MPVNGQLCSTLAKVIQTSITKVYHHSPDSCMHSFRSHHSSRRTNRRTNLGLSRKSDRPPRNKPRRISEPPPSRIRPTISHRHNCRRSREQRRTSVMVSSHLPQQSLVFVVTFTQHDHEKIGRVPTSLTSYLAPGSDASRCASE
jgi:hypothetical protein